MPSCPSEWLPTMVGLAGRKKEITIPHKHEKMENNKLGKKTWLWICFLLTLFIFMTSPETSTAMANPEGTNINWVTDDTNTFIYSVITNTLGREPNQYDRQQFEQVNNQKFQFFISVLASQEYQDQFSWLSREYHVYYTPEWNEDFTSLCNCYYFADNNQKAGLMPAMQYTGVALPPYLLSAPVARAFVEMCWTYDRNSCDRYDCGKANPVVAGPTSVVPGPTPVSGPEPGEELNRHCNHITSQLQAARERGDIDSYRNLLEGYSQCDFYDEAILLLLEQFSNPIPSPPPATPNDPKIQCEGHTIHCKAEGYPNSIGKTYSNYFLDQNKDKFCDLCGKPFTGSAVTHPGMICIQRNEQQ